MKRIMVTGIGEAKDVLEVHDVSDLRPGKGEVLSKCWPSRFIRLTLVMRGRHVFEATYPIGTGIEGAGRIIAHGEGVNEPFIEETWRYPLVEHGPNGGHPCKRGHSSSDDIDLYQGAMLALNP